MSRIRVKNFEELAEPNGQSTGELALKNEKKKTSPKKVKKQNAIRSNGKQQDATVNKTTTTKKSTKKDLLPNQQRIDSFFKSCSKTYTIFPSQGKENTEKKPRQYNTRSRSAKTAKRRKCLFKDSTSVSETSSQSTPMQMTKSNRKHKTKESASLRTNKAKPVEVYIDLCMSDESDSVEQIKIKKKSEEKILLPVASSLPPTTQLAEVLATPTCSNSVASLTVCVANTTASQSSRRKPRPLPPYKIISGTTFAVDAFQFGHIADVSHYFLTHFHADHYIGLNRKFSMPLYLSPITARLVRAFIPLAEEYIHEIPLNQTVVIEGVEVTAIDANHCPGAVMFLFKLVNGKCILHTGDFRASPEMESEPVFWNNDIDTIYLDTTYLSQSYAFCTQYESIDNAKYLVHEFREKNIGKRILYVCGSYVIGKERFWSALAEEFQLKVWTEANRKKALQAMNLKKLQPLLCDDPHKAQMHIITMNKIRYLSLVEYFQQYRSHFDVLIGIRPSGWEKNSKPQMRGTINILGVEYSEHSSYNELKRFVSFIKPRDVISTVPLGGRDLMATPKVPQNWYKYEKLGLLRNFQPSITSYLKKDKNKSIREYKERNSHIDNSRNTENYVDYASFGNCSSNVVSPLETALAPVPIAVVEVPPRVLKFDYKDAEDDWLE